MTQDFKRNEATGLDLGWLNHIHVNKAAAERRAASLANRRTVKKEYQAAWLVKAIELIDLTTLSGDDVRALTEARARAGVDVGHDPVTRARMADDRKPPPRPARGSGARRLSPARLGEAVRELAVKLVLVEGCLE